MFPKYLHCCITVSERKVIFCSNLEQSANDAKVVALTPVWAIHSSWTQRSFWPPSKSEYSGCEYSCTLFIYLLGNPYLLRLVRVIQNMIIRWPIKSHRNCPLYQYCVFRNWLIWHNKEQSQHIPIYIGHIWAIQQLCVDSILIST